MPTYSYKAVDAEGKEVRGTLEAQSIDEAKESLQQLKLEQVTVTEPMRLRKSSAASPAAGGETLTFAFEGTADDGSVRRGTVQAESKRHAFDRLRREQKLSLNMLSPVGVTPQYKDQDLLRWQRGPTAPAISGEEVPVTLVQSAKAATVQAQPVPEFHDIEQRLEQAVAAKESQKGKSVSGASAKYFPLLDTIRLYAGWLLAWYLLFVAAGYYTFQRQLPLDIPFVEGFFFSPLIFRFVAAMFVFLALSSLHKLLRGKLLSGLLLAVIGAAGYAVLVLFSGF